MMDNDEITRKRRMQQIEMKAKASGVVYEDAGFNFGNVSNEALLEVLKVFDEATHKIQFGNDPSYTAHAYRAEKLGALIRAGIIDMADVKSHNAK